MKTKTSPISGSSADSVGSEELSYPNDDLQQLVQEITQYQPKEFQTPFKGNCLLLTADQRFFVFCSVEGRVAILDRITGEIINDVQLPGGGLYSIAFYQNETYVFSGGKDAIIRQFLLKDFSLITTFKGHTDKISEIMFSPDEKWMYTCSDDKTVRIWDMSQENVSFIMYSHDDRSLSMDMTKDGTFLVTGGADKVVKVCDLTEKKLITTITGPENSVWEISINKAKTMIAAGDNNGVAWIWKFGTWEVLHKLEGHEKRVSCLDFIDNDARIVTASNDGSVRIWDLTKNMNPVIMERHTNWIKSMLISPDEEYIFTISEDYKLISWKILPARNEIRLVGHTSNIYNTIYSLKRNTFCTNANDKMVIKWDPYAQKKLHNWDLPDGIYAMCMTADEKYMVACTAGKEMYFLNLDTHESIKYDYCKDEADATTKPIIKAILATTDGKYLIYGDTLYRLTVREYKEPGDGVELPIRHIFRKQTNTVWSLAVNSDSSILFSGSEDTTIVMYSLTEFKPIATLEGHTKKVKCLSVSKDDRILISGSWDSTFRIWSIPKRTCLKEFTYHDGAINQVYFPKTENYFIVASTDSTVSFWNMRDYSFITQLKYKDLCLALTLTPDEKILIVVEKEFVYLRENPMMNNEFAMYGNGSNQYKLLDYAYRLINGKPEPHDPKLDKYLFTPTMTNMAHLYAYYNHPDLLTKAFENGISLLNSKNSKNPFTLCISKDYLDCVDIILGYLKEKIPKDPYAMLFFENDLIDLNKRGIALLDEVYDVLLIKGTEEWLPKFCSSNNRLPKIIGSNHIDPDPTDFLPAESFKAENAAGSGKSINFYYSAISLDMELGSSGSVAFMRSVADCSNQDIYRTPLIKEILDKKWQKIWWFVVLESLFYWSYLLTFTIYIVNFVGEGNFLILPFFFNEVLMIYEMYQVYSSGWMYFLDLWNYIDISSLALFNAYAFSIWSGDVDPTGNKLNTILVVITLLAFIRGISYFTVWKETRYMINLLAVVFIKMIPFLILLFYTTITFALLLFAYQSDPSLDFTTFLENSYTLNLGGFATDGYDSMDWVIFGLSTLVNPIVMLNLLIAILGDSFNDVQDNQEIADKKELASIILDIELLMSWKWKSNKKTFLQICNEEKIDAISSWNGKKKDLEVTLNSLTETIKKNYKNLEKVIDATSDTFKELQNKLEGKVEKKEGDEDEKKKEEKPEGDKIEEDKRKEEERLKAEKKEAERKKEEEAKKSRIVEEQEKLLKKIEELSDTVTELKKIVDEVVPEL